MMDTELIAAARKLAAEARERANATPLGPWSWSQTYEMFGGYYHWSLKNPRAKVEGKTIDGGFVMLHSGPDYFSEPWEKRPIPVFVAAARTDVPALADLVDQLADALEQAQAENKRLRKPSIEVEAISEFEGGNFPIWYLARGHVDKQAFIDAIKAEFEEEHLVDDVQHAWARNRPVGPGTPAMIIDLVATSGRGVYPITYIDLDKVFYRTRAAQRPEAGSE